MQVIYPAEFYSLNDIQPDRRLSLIEAIEPAGRPNGKEFNNFK